MRVVICFFMSIFFLPLSSEPYEEVVQFYKQAEEQSSLGKRREYFLLALEKYLHIENEFPKHSWKLDFNIGNCYFHLGEYGWAIFYYEKALKKAPRNPMLKDNRAIALEYAGIESGKGILNPFSFLSFDEKSVLMLAAFSVWFCLSCFSKWKRERRSRHAYAASLAIFCLFVLDVYCLPLICSQDAVLVDSSVLRIDAGQHYELAASEMAAPGEKVSVLEIVSKGEWAKVKCSNGKVGFVPYQSIRIL